jgi:phenylacetate-CoA ligase
MADGNDRGQLQFERLQSTLNRAYRNVPFHRNRQDRLAAETGRDPSILDSPEDLARLPFMTRKDLAENYPYGLFAVPLRDIVRIHTAPGTGERPTVTGYTRSDLAVWREIVSGALAAAGVGAEDILQVSLDPGLANWGRDYKEGAEAMDAAVVPNTPLSASKQLLVLRDYRVTTLVTTPSEAASLAESIYRSGVNPNAFGLRRMILVGEPPDPELRESLTERLHVETRIHYGLSEVPGPAMAFECAAREGLHLQEDHFLAEIVDPETGETLPGDAEGELVLTTLSARAFPLIRFRTGDRVRRPATPCGCGRPGTRLIWLPGRTDRLFNVNGVKVAGAQVTDHLARALGRVPDHRLFVGREPDGKNRLELWIAVDDTFFSDEIKDLEGKLRAVRIALREQLGISVRLRLREIGFLDPRPS